MCPPCELLVPRHKLSLIRSSSDKPTYFMQCPSNKTWDFVDAWLIFYCFLCYFLFLIGLPNGAINIIIVSKFDRQIRCLTWGIDEWRWGPQEKCVVVGLYILLKSHSCCCHLRSNFFFELLIMWRMRKLVHACARTDVSCGEWMRHMTSLSIRLLNKFDVTCHWWRQLNFQNHVEVKWVSHTSHLWIEGAQYLSFYGTPHPNSAEKRHLVEMSRLFLFPQNYDSEPIFSRPNPTA